MGCFLCVCVVVVVGAGFGEGAQTCQSVEKKQKENIRVKADSL